MEDDKLRELSQDFLIKNIVSSGRSTDGEIIHTFKNGRTRIIDAVTHDVNKNHR